MADVETIRGVEILHTGEWNISTGLFIVTAADLESALAAHRAGVLRKPVIKIGHEDPRFNEDPRFDGSPAMGYVDNLRIVNGGKTLLCDFVNVPSQLAALIPYAYPDRSVEALQNYVAPDGRTWPLILTGTALLGATAPGCDALQSLQDVGALYGVAAKRVLLSAQFTQRGENPARSRAVIVAGARRRRIRRLTTTERD